MATTTTKVELRKEFLTKRDALDPIQRGRSSSLIRQRVFEHPAWKSAQTILCYVSFGSEVETHPLIQEALRFKKRLVVPLHDPSNHDTLLSELKRFNDLGPNHRGVLQVKPECHQLYDPSRIDLAIVPGIVFDKQGGRIGFGGGYFDKLLPKMPRAFRLGTCYSAQLSATPLPLERHDVRLQAILTESAVIDTKAV